MLLLDDSTEVCRDSKILFPEPSANAFRSTLLPALIQTDKLLQILSQEPQNFLTTRRLSSTSNKINGRANNTISIR